MSWKDTLIIKEASRINFRTEDDVDALVLDNCPIEEYDSVLKEGVVEWSIDVDAREWGFKGVDTNISKVTVTFGLQDLDEGKTLAEGELVFTGEVDATIKDFDQDVKPDIIEVTIDCNGSTETKDWKITSVEIDF